MSSDLLAAWHIVAIIAAAVAIFAAGYVIGARDAKAVLRIERDRGRS